MPGPNQIEGNKQIKTSDDIKGLKAAVDTREEVEAFFNSDEVNRIYDELIGDKLAISEIMSLLRQQPLSTGEIAERLGLTPSAVSRHMNASSRHGLVRYDTELKRYALA
jgi:DNA-binding transcriptional ArsR family regulator